MRPENRARKREMNREADQKRHVRKAELQREYYRRNSAKHRAYYNDYLANATPKWLTNEQKAEIQWYYSEAQRLGLTVDHIWPIRGKNSCGLHVPWNLQLLTQRDNDVKGNKEPCPYTTY